MQIFILAEEIKLRAFLCLNNGIQCAGRFAAKASFVMIIIYLYIFFLQFSRCRFTMLLHLGPIALFACGFCSMH